MIEWEIIVTIVNMVGVIYLSGVLVNLVLLLGIILFLVIGTKDSKEINIQIPKTSILTSVIFSSWAYWYMKITDLDIYDNSEMSIDRKGDGE